MNRSQKLQRTEFLMNQILFDLQKTMRENDDVLRRHRGALKKEDNDLKVLANEINDAWNALDDVCEHILGIIEDAQFVKESDDDGEE